MTKPRKYASQSDFLENVRNVKEPAYVSWGGETGDDVKTFANFLEGARGISHKALGRWNTDLSDLDTNISGRPGLSKQDYYAFRPEEAPARSFKGAIYGADMAYQTVGLIRNIIDLMADFGTQGIRLVHPNKRIEKFYRSWFARVNGVDRSERFLNNLYRSGNVIVRKQNARIKTEVKKSLFKTVAEPETKVDVLKVTKNEIPWRYTFLNPLYVEIIGGPLTSFVGQPTYAIKLPSNLIQTIRHPKTPEERVLVAQLPAEIKQAATTSQPVPLPIDKTRVYHYKKDDWQPWAYPMIYAIMDDIAVLEKLRLADMCALDGAISNIRIFKLGNLEHKIMPHSGTLSYLSEILESNVGGGTLDLVWGPDIELLESKTTVHQFLGEEKYRPHLTAIYAGLGIPPTLTGTLTGSGTTNNLISLKTLLGRLEYGRNVLTNFWEREIIEVQRAMGFRFPAKLEFRFAQLGDEAAEKALLIQLADRNLISDELIQHLFGNDSEIERIRINRESRERHEGKLVQKSGPFYDPQFGIALKKVALQSGVVTPGQVGLKKDAVIKDMRMSIKDGKEQPALLMRQPQQSSNTPISDQKKGQPNQGRPKNSKDKQKRKQKRFTPVTKASLEIWARDVQLTIAEVLNPLILKHYKKKNMRSLTKEEANAAEDIKFDVLCNLEPFSKTNEQSVLQASNQRAPKELYDLYKGWVQTVSKEINRVLTLDELKHIQASAYATYIGE